MSEETNGGWRCIDTDPPEPVIEEESFGPSYEDAPRVLFYIPGSKATLVGVYQVLPANDQRGPLPVWWAQEFEKEKKALTPIWCPNKKDKPSHWMPLPQPPTINQGE